MNPSRSYVEALELSKAQHRESKTYSGKFLRPHRTPLKEIIDRLGCKTILDYGCGKCLQYEWRMGNGQTIEEFWGIEVAKYDPAHPAFAQEPEGTYDLVIVTHVLGIIPIPDLEWVVDRIYGFADKAVYFAIDTGATLKKSKERWRVANIPRLWNEKQWLSLLNRRKNKDIEVHVVIREPHARDIEKRTVL